MPESDGPSEELLSILVCPICRKQVEQKGAGLVCGTCGRCYAIRDGIPDMVVEDDAGRERG